MAWWNSKGESIVTKPESTLRKMMFSRSLQHQPCDLFHGFFRCSSTWARYHQKNSPLRDGNTKREQTCAEHPSLQTMILSYLATLISSAFSIFFFKHVNAAALLCSLLLLTTATEYSLGLHLPVILYNAKCAISKICTLNLVLLWVFVRLNIIYMDKNLSMI